MKKCIDCDFRFNCGKANATVICNKFQHTAGTVTKLDEKNGEVYKFSKLEVTEDEEKNSN